MPVLRTAAVDPGQSFGTLQVNVVSAETNSPVQDATVDISLSSAPEEILEEVTTDLSGQSEEVRLEAPPLEYSLSPDNPRPYQEYTIRVAAPGFEPVTVTGSELLPDVLSLQPIRMEPARTGDRPEAVFIPDHTLYGTYPPKIAEAAVKPINQSGEIVLSRVVVPETIVVHDGTPANYNAQNYFVPYRDYIKNVASSEIYATWPRESITANVLVIMSFTMNRIYTEWYRNQGYDFVITSSTAYDQKWVYGRNIFQEISEVVDEIFDQYITRPNIKQPLLTQYCDGRRTTCPNWLSQWGSKDLAERGYTPIEILRYYYGDEVYINTAEQISGIPASWPRYDLTVGTSGDKVRQIQEQLLTVSQVYSAIPSLTPSGYYDEATAEAVREFQSIFGLPQTGVVDFSTWYKISHIYVGITRLGELN